MHLPSKEEGPRDIGNNMSMILDTREPDFVSQQWLQFHIWFIMTLFSKCDRYDNYFITKCDSFITKCVVYYKMRRYTFSFHIIGN